jgi:hypothetical protein
LQHSSDLEPEGETACIKALAIAESLGDTEYHLMALWGLWLRVTSPKTSCWRALSIPESFSRVAEIHGDPSAQYIGDVMTAYSLFNLGNLKATTDHIDAPDVRALAAGVP